MDQSIFRAYDIRGIYRTELTDGDAYNVGQAIFKYLSPTKVAVGRDVRLGAPGVHRAVLQAFIECGCEVTDLGVTSTDMVSFAAGKYDFDVAIQVTASHNPKEWIGMKISTRGGATVGGSGEIQEIQALVEVDEYVPNDTILAQVTKKNLMPDWVKHVLSFIDPAVIDPLYIVVDAGNGVAGGMVREVFEQLPVAVTPMYFEPDGNFPNHLPSPIEPENTEVLRKKVVETGADLGMAFDGDADRVFLIDENGQIVTGSEMTAMVVDEILTQNPGQVVLHNAICGWNVRDVLAKHKATAHRTKVGHGYIKKDMRTYDAYFAGEHSGHYFFKDNFSADSGIIAAMFVLQLLSKKKQSLSQVLEPYRKYKQIPETNFTVEDARAVMEKISAASGEGEVDWLDGLTVKYPDFWFNVRPSSNEPLLRLNLEAISDEVLEREFVRLRELITQPVPSVV